VNYLPQEIVYDRPQIEWIWENILLLREGIWPDIPTSEYTEIPGGQSINRHAHFETACLVAAEAEARANMCETDGVLLEDKYVRGKDDRQISQERHMYLDDVSNRIRKVLGYSASGRKRRSASYSEWKRQFLQRRRPF